MIQQVNLYRGRLKPQRTPLSSRWLAIALLATLAILGGIYAVMTWQLDQRQSQLARLETERDRLASSLEKLNQRLAAREVDAELTQRAEALAKELRIKRQLVGVLGGETSGNIDGFSTLLAGLARRHIEGLWLEEIVFRQGGEALALRGRATRAGLVPDYLEALRQEAAYQGRRFASFRMQRRPEARGLGFVIATRCPGVAPDAVVERAAACFEGSD